MNELGKDFQIAKDLRAHAFTKCATAASDVLQLASGKATMVIIGAGATEGPLSILAGLVCDAANDIPQGGPVSDGHPIWEKILTEDSFLFAALLTVHCRQVRTDRGYAATPAEFNPLEAAHKDFEKLRGHVFKDVFLRTCSCKDCARRRKHFGIELKS